LKKIYHQIKINIEYFNILIKKEKYEKIIASASYFVPFVNISLDL
jgi:hypothetical protein